MKIVYFGNNLLGFEILRWLKEQGEEIVGLVLHPAKKRRCGDEMAAAAGLPEDAVFSGERLREEQVLAQIAALQPDLGISILFDYILAPALIAQFPLGIVNLHPALLPYNRGQYPNVWSIVERTPSGTTLHYIDAGVDTGDIIAQRVVYEEPIDTGETLYRKLMEASRALFRDTWPLIRAGTAPRSAQVKGGGTSHRTRDVEKIDEIELDRAYLARDLIDLLRARTFPPYQGAYFETPEGRVQISVKLEYRPVREQAIPPPLLLLRVDLSPQHGTGHLMRSKALGDSWKRASGRVEFATTSDLAPYAEWLAGWPVHRLSSPPGSLADAEETRALAAAHDAAWVAADGYHFDAAWQQAFGDHPRLLLFDDDGHGIPHHAAMILNQSPAAAEVLYAARSEGTKLLLGPRFATLRDQFMPWRKWRRQTAPQARRLLMTFGGTDPAGLTLRAIEALRGLPLEVEVVVGAGNLRTAEIEARCAGTDFHVRRNVLDMPELMASCDFALCAAGSTTLEAAFLQLPQILITVADNQPPHARALSERGAAELLGWHTDVSDRQIAEAVNALGSAGRRAAMSAAASSFVDGLGSERVVTHLRASCLQLRPAEVRDERRIWEWANDPVTRAAYFNSERITWDEHREWFRRQLSDPEARLEIGEASAPFGLIRFSLAGEEADVSVGLAPESRGLGLAAPFILRGSHALFRAGPTRVIHAYIKPENAASSAAFQRAGYRHRGHAAPRGHHAEHYTLEAAEVPEWERV